MPEFVVYTLTNRLNGKVYVGITSQGLAVRWRAHVRAAMNPEAHRCAIRSAIKKHGEDAFDVVHFASATSRADLLQAEIQVIAQFCSNDGRRGYNMTVGGETPSPACRSPAARAKAAAKMRGQRRSSESIEASRLKRIGAKRSPEQCERMSAAKRGKKQNPAHAAASAAHLNKLRTEGRIPLGAPQAVEKMKATWAAKRADGYTATPEHRAKISTLHTGKVTSEETKAKMRAAHLARSQTPEGKAAHAIGAAKRRAKQVSAEGKATLAAAWAKRRAAATLTVNHVAGA